MEGKDLELLQKIHRQAVNCVNYCSDCKSAVDFMKSGMLVRTCGYKLLQISDWVAEISPEAKKEKEFEHIRWDFLANAGRMLVNDETGVNCEMAWDIIANDMPELKEAFAPYAEQ